MLGALAFFTKYTQLIPIVLLGVIDSFKNSRFKLSHHVKFVLGYILLSSPFLIIHYFIYGHIFYPFTESSKIYNQIPFQWNEGIIHCLKILFKAESWIFLFIPISVYSLFRRNFDTKKITILVIGLSLFALFGKLPTDLPRFFISALPYLYLLSADGFIQCLSYPKKLQSIPTYFFAAIIFILLANQFYRISTIRFPRDHADITKEYIEKNTMNGIVWISNPTPFSRSNIKIHELMYYPVFDTKKISDLKSKLSTADFIFWDSRSLVCVPKNDPACLTAKEELAAAIFQNFTTEICFKNDSGHIIYGIFVKYRSQQNTFLLRETRR